VTVGEKKKEKKIGKLKASKNPEPHGVGNRRKNESQRPKRKTGKIKKGGAVKGKESDEAKGKQVYQHKPEEKENHE